MNLPQPAIDFLVTLGFPPGPLTERDADRAYHPDHPGIYVALRTYSTNPDYFRLSFEAGVRSGGDHVYIGAPNIFPCLVDIRKPRWKQTVAKWFQKTVFATKPARVSAERRASFEARRRARVARIVGPELAHTLPQIERICNFTADYESAEISEVDFSYRSFRFEWHNYSPAASTAEDVAKRLRAVTAVLETARAHGIKFD